ncbi:MAG: hypothetical protein ABJD13_10460 [Paracoccaceae bacterium]
MKDLGGFLRSAFGPNFVPTLNRRTRTQRASGKTDQNALLVWQAAVLTKADQNPPIGNFSKELIDKKFLRSIAKLSTPPKAH